MISKGNLLEGIALSLLKIRRQQQGLQLVNTPLQPDPQVFPLLLPLALLPLKLCGGVPRLLLSPNTLSLRLLQQRQQQE